MAIYRYETEFNKSYRTEEQIFSSNQVEYSNRMTEDKLLLEFGKLQSRAEFWITQFTFDPYGFTVPNFKNGEVNNVFIHLCINENMLSKKYTLDDVIKHLPKIFLCITQVYIVICIWHCTILLSNQTRVSRFYFFIQNGCDIKITFLPLCDSIKILASRHKIAIHSSLIPY